MSVDIKKGKTGARGVVDATEPKQKTCFVIMPIADHPDYSPGHFMRVYDYIIKPACIKADFVPDRADDAQHTHFIMMNILQRILDADMAICDLSGKNPNVMYELGIRQAFDKPVTLIKDEKTSRVFDTGMLSDAEYYCDLRIDNVQVAIDSIATRLRNTYEKKDDHASSLIQLMKIDPAKPPAPTLISPEVNILLDAITTLGRRITALEPRGDGLGLRYRQDGQRGVLQRERERLVSEVAFASSTILALKSQIESLNEAAGCLDNSSMRERMHNDLVRNEVDLQLIQEKMQALDRQIARADLASGF
jgi:hypothetical protein